MKKALFSVIVLLHFSCGQPDTKQQSEQLRIGMRRAPDSLNPYMATTLQAEAILARLFPSLFKELTELKDGTPLLKPYLVESYQISPDQKEIRIQLKAGLVWSDGQPLTAQDVAYTLKTQQDPKLGWLNSGRKLNIERVQVIDSQRLKFYFKKATPFNLLDLNEGYIIPKHYFSAFPLEDWKRDWASDLVVYGPYKITSQGENSMVLEGLKGDIPRLGIVFVRERETIFQMLKTGQLDYSWTLPVQRIPDIKDPIKPNYYDSYQFSFIGWNPIQPSALAGADLSDKDSIEQLKKTAPHPIFAEPIVRRAMAHAINRTAYIQQFLQGAGTVPTSPWQVGLAYASYKHQPRTYDPDKAATLLDQAGWTLEGQVRKKEGQPFRFTMQCNISKGIREHYMIAMQQDLKQIGVEMEISLQEGGQYMERCFTRNFDAMFGTFRGSSRPDMSGIYRSDSTYNFTSWTSADEALDQVHDANSLEDIRRGLQQLEEIYYQEQPILLLYQRKQIAASTQKVYPRATAIDPLFEVEHWLKKP